MLEVLYHHAKFGGARISPATGAAKNVEFFVSVCLFIKLVNVRVCMHNFTPLSLPPSLSSSLPPPSLPTLPSLTLFLPTCIPPSLVLTALGVLRMLPVLQRLGDAYGF